jgi:hypothetical protein
MQKNEEQRKIAVYLSRIITEKNHNDAGYSKKHFPIPFSFFISVRHF